MAALTLILPLILTYVQVVNGVVLELFPDVSH